MKTKVTILNVESSSQSILKMKEKNGKKKIKLVNSHGFCQLGKTRMTLIKHCALGDEEKVIIENDRFIIEVDFATICDLRDILCHEKDLGNNWFGETKVLK